jgi:ribosomal protein S27E
MVHTDFGWSCPQCGSAIVEPSKGEAGPRDEASELSTRAARAARG